MWPFSPSQPRPQSNKDANSDNRNVGTWLRGPASGPEAGSLEVARRKPGPISSSSTPLPSPPQLSWKDGAIVLGILLTVSFIPYRLNRSYASKIKQDLKELSRQQKTLDRTQDEMFKLHEGTLEYMGRIEKEQKKFRESIEGLETKLVGMKASAVQMRRENEGILGGLKKLSDKWNLDKYETERRVQQLEDELMMTREHLEREVALRQSIGTTLADIAKFMHEVELVQPGLPVKSAFDVRGIEKMRKLALRLQSPVPPPPQSMDDAHGPADDCRPPSTPPSDPNESQSTKGQKGDTHKGSTANSDPFQML